MSNGPVLFWQTGTRLTQTASLTYRVRRPIDKPNWPAMLSVMPRPDRIFLCTGESSGDLHAANLIRAVRAARPETEFCGLGGDRMAEVGCRLHRNLLGLAAMWHKTLGTVLHLVPLLSEVDRFFADHPPDVVVVLDYPGFNFPLARRATSRGIPVLWYCPPQMWAWGRWRMPKLRNRVAGVACIFPFEEELYRSAGVPVRYVGHPLMDELAEQLDRPLGEGADVFPAGTGPKIGLLPGSRKQEVQTLLPVMLEVAAAVRAVHPHAVFRLGRANPTLIGEIAPRVTEAVRAGLPIEILDGRTHDIQRHADLLLVASGTATLEAGLFGTPMVILYSIDPRLHAIARQFILSPHIGLANVVAGKRAVPEFAPVLPATSVIIAEVLDILARPERLSAMRADLRAVRQKIGPPGASRRAAEEVLALADRSRFVHRDGRRRGCPNSYYGLW